ncbi:transcriptional regulator, MarR family [Aquipluma nitroreducens]|uniref:Transcriptional regulator, MarR family n=1 Tax=Aquipluma nitroreducens TaxID=2010828 RepID=A0A5K7S8W9_9BACT|nr:MarR family transcriptional regulator [Aquipluma nitroreducens]BBE17935.1 transcriptional regulator, MarR family [Aquipluma nitroreducens]
MEQVKPLGYILGLPLRIFLNQVAVEFRNRDIELTFEQFIMLLLIDSKGDLIQQDIANHLQKDKSIVVRQMNGLIEKEYVVRLPNRTDKRKKNLILTTKGTEIMNKITELNFEVSSKLLSGVDEDDYLAFGRVLNKIQENGGFLIEQRQ